MTETTRGTNPDSSRSAAALVLGTIGLLAGLVWAISPSRPRLDPAPLRPLPPGCFKSPHEFVPSNVTEIPDLPFEELGREAKNRALLRLNMEPCPCGCALSLAECRVAQPDCETSKEPAKSIVAEEKGQPDKQH